MISKYLKPSAVIDIQSEGLEGAFIELGEALRRSYKVKLTPVQIAKKMLEREQVSSTAIDKGFAIPHVRDPRVRACCIAIGISRQGLAMQAIDGRPSHLLIMLLGPDDEPARFLLVLSLITKTIQKLDVQEIVRNSSPDDLYQRILQMG